MSKRKLYPDECPVFEVVTHNGVFHVEGTGAPTWSSHYPSLHQHLIPYYLNFNIVDCAFPRYARPLTPAAVELWEHVAGREWKP